MKGRRRPSKLDILAPKVKVTAIQKRTAIPKALREEVWRKYIGTQYESKCTIVWCTNKITPFDYEVGHNIPHSKGGTNSVDNLRPICSRCNKSMSDDYTIDQWNELGKSHTREATAITSTSCCCFSQSCYK